LAGEISAARFRPPDNPGGGAALGLSVSGRTITTISKRIEVPSSADIRRSLKLLRSPQPARSPDRAPHPLWSKKSPGLKTHQQAYGEHPARLGLMSPLAQSRHLDQAPTNSGLPHRRAKGAATRMLDLTPPRDIPTLPFATRARCPHNVRFTTPTNRHRGTRASRPESALERTT
jgi:hypothetical protein